MQYGGGGGLLWAARAVLPISSKATACAHLYSLAIFCSAVQQVAEKCLWSTWSNCIPRPPSFSRHPPSHPPVLLLSHTPKPSNVMRSLSLTKPPRPRSELQGGRFIASPLSLSCLTMQLNYERLNHTGHGCVLQL